ncbi:MAG: lytic transglycosylase domain-containing protein [Gammaproteobacteria bacterium]|nr:lytic transglycosylase domain-containing protein [Gammaproteobacteria bacterium]
MKRAAAFILLLATTAAAPLRADIYAYRDARGVTHFTNVPTDTRYHLILRTPTEMAAAAIASPAGWQRRAAAYHGTIERAAAAATLQSDLVHAVIAVESGFDPRAVSPKGGMGLMQLMPATAKRYGAADPFDPEQNIRAGTRYLGELLVRFDRNVELALAAYNAGEGAVERNGRQIPPYDETRRYVPSVLKVMAALKARRRPG